MACLSNDKDDHESNVLAASRLIRTAQVEISCLEFINGWQIDKQIVDKLAVVFEQARCRRYDPENIIPVLIT